MVNMLHSKIRVNDSFRYLKSGDFEVEDKEHWKPPKKFKDVELQALLDQTDSQTQKQLAEQLGVSCFQTAREMGKIQKTGRWEPRELNDRQMKKRKNT